jgi:hypothetical protein
MSLDGIETAATLGTRRRGRRVRPMLKAVRSGTVIERDGTRHDVVAGRDYWHGVMLSRMRPEYADFFVVTDASAEFRAARRSRRSKRSTDRPRKVWRLP